MKFFTFYFCVFLFIKKVDWRKRSVCFAYVDLFHIGGITKSDALFGEAAVHLILDVIDYDDTVNRYPAFYLQEK